MLNRCSGNWFAPLTCFAAQINICCPRFCYVVDLLQSLYPPGSGYAAIQLRSCLLIRAQRKGSGGFTAQSSRQRKKSAENGYYLKHLSETHPWSLGHVLHADGASSANKNGTRLQSHL